MFPLFWQGFLFFEKNPLISSLNSANLDCLLTKYSIKIKIKMKITTQQPPKSNFVQLTRPGNSIRQNGLLFIFDTLNFSNGLLVFVTLTATLILTLLQNHI